MDSAIGDTEYAVYGALLSALVDPDRERSLRPTVGVTSGPVVVCRRVELFDSRDPGLGDLECLALGDLVAKSLARTNGRWLSLPSTIDRALPTPVPHVVGEDRGDAEQPHGIVFLSRVGLDPNQHVALVYVCFRAFALCARMGFASLTREAAGWRLAREYVVGVA